MSRNIKLLSILVMWLSLVGKLISLIRDMLVASEYGASYVADAYNVSYILVIILFGLINSSIYNTILPLMTKEYSLGKDKLFNFIDKLISLYFIVGVIIVFISIFYSNSLVHLLAPDLSQRSHDLAIKLVRLSMLSFIALLFNSIFNAALRVFDEFILPSIGAALFSIPNIIYLCFYSQYGVEGLTITTVVGFIFQVIIQIPPLFRKGYRFKLTLNYNDPRLKTMVKLMPPILISSGLIQINSMVDNIFASKLSEGSITILTVASKINGIIFTIIGTSLITVIYPILSKQFASKDLEGFQKILRNAINNIITIVLPSSLLVIIFREEIVKILFMRGSFGEKSVHLTSMVLLSYMVGLLFFILRDIFAYAFYAANDTVTPMKISAISITSNILLNILLYKKVGVMGIALATSIAAIINFIQLGLSLNKRIIKIKINFLDLCKSIIGSIIISIVAVFLKNMVINAGFFEMSLILILTVCIYIILLSVMKHSEMNTKLIINLLKKKVLKG